MSAITAALSQIDGVAAEGDLVPEPTAALELATPGEPILLPDGKRIYPPCLHGAPVDELALALLDMDDPAKSTFLRLIGPPGAGKSQIARAIAYRLWTGRGREVADRHGAPFYGFVELQPGPSSDEFFFRYDYVPVAGSGGQVALVDSAFVQAMREGWVVMIDEVNTARDVALLSINATLDGRLSLYLAATGETVVAKPGFAVLLAYNPGLVGATDIPDAWHSRFPATLEVTSNWAALIELGAPAPLVTEAMRLDRQRIAGEDGLCWTPQFRDIESLWRMSERVGERAALAFFASNLHEQVTAGKIQDAEAAAACRMLDQAGYGRLRVSASSGTAEPARLPAGGDLMSPGTRTSGRPAVFVQQLHRAAAQRGRLDPVYQDLSDHWTLVLQRLYPVWALIGPGLSDPGHIEIHSRDRLPRLRRAARVARRRSPPARSSGGRSCGASGSRCTRRCTPSTPSAGRSSTTSRSPSPTIPTDRQLAVDRRLLEEPRMEAHGVREFPPDSLRGRFVRRALQAAVADVILPAFTGQVLELAAAGQPLTRDLAARATVYLQARTQYGIVDPADLTGLGELWRAVLGEHDLRALDDLYARLVWIPDGELERLDEAAREYRRIVGEPDPPPSAGGTGAPGRIR